jgi:hypothetical protein
MSEPAPPATFPVDAAAIGQAHQLYCQLTDQTLRLAFDRERMWYELLRLGYSLPDLRTAPYLHDGSAATVRDVVTMRNRHDRHGKTSNLTAQEIDDLCAYLLSL